VRVDAQERQPEAEQPFLAGIGSHQHAVRRRGAGDGAPACDDTDALKLSTRQPDTGSTTCE
jgi:hypothetical protein